MKAVSKELGIYISIGVAIAILVLVGSMDWRSREEKETERVLAKWRSQLDGSVSSGGT